MSTTAANKRLLIANRGEIACRILRTAHRLGYFVVAIYTAEDAASAHVSEADAAALVSFYTSIDDIIKVVESLQVRLVIPGYGSLSENAEFALRVEQHGAGFVGPSAEHIGAFGLKDKARVLAEKAHVPIVPGSDLVETVEVALREADRLGYPIMMKATAGGGGMGLQICQDASQLCSAYDAVVNRSQTLDLDVRCKVQAVVEVLDAAQIPGVVSTQPMGCGLLLQYESPVISQNDLVKRLLEFLRHNNETNRLLSSRIIRLPMVFDDKANREAIEKYTKLQRPYASYLPDPIEFIAKANGLESRHDVLRLVLQAQYLVVGVGFFSGTPLALPLDPRSQLTVPKFNPSRTFSPAGGLGFGGSYLCCDPVDAPVGYVNFGRTIPGWDQFCRNKESFGDQPWLFRNFDQLSFYQVTEEEFGDIYAKFKAGQFSFDIQDVTFDVDQRRRFCEDIKGEVAAFKDRQHAANASCRRVESPMHANVYKVLVKKGQILKEGEILFVLETMKMEVKVCTPIGYEGCKVKAVAVLPGDVVVPGNCMLLAKE
ncbi:hypothetical protein ACJ41O_003367 [Fusarium nematophilum]